MWGLLYVALLVLATAMTYWGVVVHGGRRDPRMIVAPSGIASATWALLAITPEVVLDDGTTITLGAERWVFTACALICGVWLAGYVLGIFPEERPESVSGTASQRRFNS